MIKDISDGVADCNGVVVLIIWHRFAFSLIPGSEEFLCAVGSSFDDAEPRRARQHLAPLLLSIWLPLVAELDQQPSLPTMPLAVLF